MKVTTKNLEKLCKNCNYDPRKIGISVLRGLGYNVHEYQYSPEIYVYTKDGKKLLNY